jgi:hypothetical protein
MSWEGRAGHLILSDLQKAVAATDTSATAAAVWIDKYLSTGWDEARFRDALRSCRRMSPEPGIAGRAEHVAVRRSRLHLR